MYSLRRRDFILGSSTLLMLGISQTAIGQLAAEITPHEKDLYESAKKEGGELTWYTAQSDDITAQALGRSFESLYPSLKVNVLRTTAQVAYQRVTQEIKASAIQCDVFSSTDIGHSVALKARGAFEKFVPDNASKVLDIYKGYDPDGYYFVTSAGLIGIGYNTAKVKEPDAPNNWTNLLDPKWNNNIALGHPGFSGYVGTWALTLRNQYGWEFFEKLAKNNPRVGRSINDTVTMLNAGESSIAGSGPAGTLLQSAQKGNPLALSYPADGTVLIIAPSSIMKGCKHPATARLFMEFLLSARASQIWANHFNESIRPEVSPHEGAISAKDIKVIRPTVEQITRGVPEVIKQWRETFGV
ncbi:ABC transporter substrate-binding protein [Bradyrhizobium cenepequi]|uniref:ABC transporter substrate-binding protein n=1 Tax=Bradyrhizobium cenepequi TaxID=2821403 RepID=UPI001CE2D006|nr:extracellular solute-binding protein [Bradyrhizobium cenepequi]MCA6112241.1 extracellular solute-binding protein [Bradyrhizobium cenepequi]